MDVELILVVASFYYIIYQKPQSELHPDYGSSLEILLWNQSLASLYDLFLFHPLYEYFLDPFGFGCRPLCGVGDSTAGPNMALR